MNGLSEDENGNIIVKLLQKNNNTTHDIALNYNHRPSKQQTSKIECIKQLASNLKDLVINNIVRIIDDQIKKESLVEYASMFDMHRLITFEDRIILP